MLVSCDLSNRELKTISEDDIPRGVEELILKSNCIDILPKNIFQNYSKIWNLDLRSNRFNDLSFLQIYRGFGILDLRNNVLELDELVQIKHIYVLRLYIQGNSFERFLENQPLFLPSILKRVWVLDGVFISDHIRKSAKEYKGTISFGETVIAARREKSSMLKQTGASQAAQIYLNGNATHFQPPGTYMHSNGAGLIALNKRPQIERIQHLADKYPIDFHFDTFEEGFGIALALYSSQLMDEPIETIARIICRGFYATVAETLDKLENWEQLIILLQISKSLNPTTSTQKALWDALKITKYLNDGAPPLYGSTPRLILSSFIYKTREPDGSHDALSYVKFRKACNYVSEETDLETIYNECIANIPTTARKIPEKNDIVAIRHPFTDKWVNATVTAVRNGRVFTQIEDSIVQFPISALFWDGRGVWREAQPRDRVHNRSAPAQLKETFLTAAETTGDHFGQTFAISNTLTNTKGIPLPSTKHKIREPTVLLQRSVSAMSQSPFLNTAKPVVSERKVQPRFRGVLSVDAPERHPIKRIAPSRTPTQLVQGVVNIVFGQDIGGGKKLRKFHVKTMNPNTGKISYMWVNEDEIPPADVERLVGLYRDLIESKMTIVSSL